MGGVLGRKSFSSHGNISVEGKVDCCWSSCSSVIFALPCSLLVKDLLRALGMAGWQHTLCTGLEVPRGLPGFLHYWELLQFSAFLCRGRIHRHVCALEILTMSTTLWFSVCLAQNWYLGIGRLGILGISWLEYSDVYWGDRRQAAVAMVPVFLKNKLAPFSWQRLSESLGSLTLNPHSP